MSVPLMHPGMHGAAGAMQAYLEKLQHVSHFSTDFQAASAAVAAFMYQVCTFNHTASSACMRICDSSRQTDEETGEVHATLIKLICACRYEASKLP